MLTNDFRQLAQKLATFSQAELDHIDQITGTEYLPLDNNETEELSVMFREELNKLNANNN